MATSSATGEAALPLLFDKHRDYVLNLEKTQGETFEYWVTEHLRMSGVYWGLSAMFILGKEGDMDLEAIVRFVNACVTTEGGYGGNIGHDPHLLYTLSAVQILAMLDRLQDVNREAVIGYVVARQQEDGSFTGDAWGEVDTRFSYTALATLAILNALDRVNVAKAIEYIGACKNFDGGFGCTPGAESHAGQVFCCVGALAIAGGMRHVDSDLLGWWLAERQTAGGGLNGRPEKLPDVCYSWWILSALSIVDRVHWINKERLRAFILDAQDDEGGGIADRPGDMVDVFHTYFGLAGLALLGEEALFDIDPVYALPCSTVKRLGLPTMSHLIRP